MLKCDICGREFARSDYLGRHITRTHKLKIKEYYDKYIKTENEGICKECGKETHFLDLHRGYNTFCSRACSWRYITNQDSVKKKREKTCIEKWGVKQALSVFRNTDPKLNQGGTPESIRKAKKTKKERYGDETYNNYEQCKKTKKDRYGDEQYNNREKNTKTLTEKYSENGEIINTPFQIPAIKHKTLSNLSKMKKPEKKLYEFLTNRKYDFKYSYECNGKNFDFAIFKENKLSILIEIDGLYYHGLIEDYNGRFVGGQYDCERFSKVPDGVKFIVCDENNVEACFKQILEVENIDYDKWVNNIIDSLPTEFPYPEYDMKRMQKDYKHLKEFEYNSKSYVGFSIIRNYHKSIWAAHVNYKRSPVECWKDRASLEKVVKNRIIYSNNLSSQKIADGFNICKEAPKVSVFKPMVAKYLIEKYLNEFSTIFDPFSGFSGRLLGACACGKKYIGQDINFKHVEESLQIIRDFNLNAEIRVKDVMEDRGEYECLMTCSPYNLKEIWNENEMNHSCDEWIDICLERYKCKKYLFIVDNTEKYKEKIIDTINNKSHFGNNSEYVVIIETP